MKFRLSDADRERLGCPDELDVSVDVLPVQECEALEAATGIEYADVLELVVPRTVRVDERTIRFSWRPKGVRLLVWLGLYRAGITVPFDELTFDYRRFAGWETYTEPEGKGQGSPAGESPTPSTSRTSSPRTRSRRSKAST